MSWEDLEMKPITSLFLVVAVMATMSTASGSGHTPRPLAGELIHAPCFIRTGGSVGNDYKSCIAEFEKNRKATIFALRTPEGDVYILAEQKGVTFEGFRLGDQVRVIGVRTIMVGSMKKMQ